ncbi:MAG: hypothetical protein P4M08_09915 [Oligoflexia bacterium]|nr:hypothetical protein [Oligoflexia bacterium]
MDLHSLFRKPGFIVGAAAIIMVATGAVVAGISIQESHTSAANDLLFQARKSLETESQALTQELKPSAAAKQEKADVAAAAASAANYAKIDVAAKFPETLKKFTTITETYPSTRAAFEARLAIGSLFFDHGDSTHALEWFQKAATNAPKSSDRAAALQSEGYAYENLGKPADALQAYKKALDQGDANIQADLQKAIARCEAQKSAKGA